MASDAEPVDIGLRQIGPRINAALEYAQTISGDEIRAHYLHGLQQITDVVGLEDLTTTELVSLTALLIPAHGRVLMGRGLPDDPATAGKVLSLIKPSDNVAG